MQWLYRLIRQRTRPVPRYKARMIHDRLSVVYYMLAWTAGGYAFLQLIAHDPTVLPDDLNVHVDPKDKVKGVYLHAQRINKPDDVTKMKVINFKNFSIESVEDISVKELKQKLENTKSRQDSDFFGGPEEEERGEKQEVTM